MVLKMNEKISVIMGIYNCAETLEEAVDCIVKQTYTNWEVIMCDDCSTDETLRVAQRLAECDERIKVITNEKNLTLAPTLNHCLSIAKGKYIARMDGDDICAYDRFEKELLFLEENPEYSLVSCNMNLFDNNGIYRTIRYLQNPTKQDLIKTSQFCHAGCMMKKDVILKLGGYSESIDRQRVEDYDLWIRMYAEGFKGYNLQEALYSMRDDRNALHRRTLRNRINEVRVKFNACRRFDLSFRFYIRSFIPILKWLVPSWIYKFVHKNR